MKIHTFIFTIFLLAAGTLHAADLKVEISPRTVTAGVPAELILSCEGTSVPEIAHQPQIKGLTWLGFATSRRTSIVNWKSTSVMQRSFSFVIDEPGEYTIPAMEVRIGKKTVKTKPVPLTVQKATVRTPSRSSRRSRQVQEEPQVELDDALFAKVEIPGGRKEFFTGESIPIEVTVYCLAGLKLNLGYPVITSAEDKLTFRDYKAVNPDNPGFNIPTSFTDRIDGRDFICYRFQTEATPLATGPLELTVQTPTELQVPNQNRRSMDPFFDDFFESSFFTRRVRHTITAKLNGITVKPLPRPQAGSGYLGLAGIWRIEPSLSSEKTKIGDAVTLNLQIRGQGGLESLKAPELKIPGFRVYSPEISRNKDGISAEIRYIMIPLKAGKMPVDITFSTFDTKKGKYTPVSFHREITVEESDAALPSGSGPNVVDSSIPASVETVTPKHLPSGILYLKRSPYEKVTLPLWKNSIGWIVFLLVFGGLVMISGEIAAKICRDRKNDSGLLRQTTARKNWKKLSAALKEESCSVFDQAPAIAEYVNNARNFPPGTSLDEAAENLNGKYPELAKELKTISAGAWAPGAGSFPAERRNVLIKALAKLLCLVLCVLTSLLNAGESEAIKSYDAGDFNKAEAWYRSQLFASEPSPALLYDLGNCLYQQGDYALASAAYAKALLLEPRSLETLQNLNLARRKLNLPEVRKVETPSDILPVFRDSMRPDEWLLLAAAGLCFSMILFGLRHFFRSPVKYYGMILGLLVMILGLTMAGIQSGTSYHPGKAVITEKIALHLLPSADSIQTDTELIPGETVQILETRPEWVRIRAGAAEGWTPSKSIEKLL